MAVRITSIKKDGGNHSNSHEGITDYRWLNPENGNVGESSRAAIVEWLEKGNLAYVQDRMNNKAYCYVRSINNGSKFLQTVADRTYTDNLLSLPEYN